MNRHALRWYRFRGTRSYVWTVLLVTPQLLASCLAPSHAPVRGLTIANPDASNPDASLYLVLVDASQSRADQDETLHHELMHVAAHESDDVLHDAAEERAIRAMSPRLLPIFQNTAGLRWPRRPRGVRAFERHAQTFTESEPS